MIFLSKNDIIIKSVNFSIFKEENFMYAKYKSESFFLGWVNEVRESKLGYSHTLFGEILDLGDAGSYYLCKKTRGDYLRPEILIRVFIAEYNFNLFIKKYNKMSEILEKAIEDKIIKPDTTLEIMYPQTRVALVRRFNPYLVKPPTSIFTEQICLVPDDFFLDDEKCKEYNYEIFDEDKFDEDLRYISMITDGDIASLPISDAERLEAYIGKRTDELIEECVNSEFGNPQDVYWLYAMNLLYKEVVITSDCFQHLQRLYPELKTDGWPALFDNIGMNKSLKSPQIYNDENVIFFKDRQNTHITQDNLPIFYIKYNFKEMKKEERIENSNKDDNTILTTSYFKQKCEKAKNGFVKLIDIYMMFAQCYADSTKSEDEIFTNTCYTLSTYGIYVPFKSLRIMELWIVQNHFSADETKFILAAKNLFKGIDIARNAKNMKVLKGNIEPDPIKFSHTVAVDFSFISNISTAMCSQLCKELEQTTNEFKKRNNLE